MLVLALATRRGRVAPWVLRTASGVWMVLVVGRYFDVMAPALYGRPVNLYWDARHLSAVVAMMTDAVAGPVLAALLIAIAVALGVAYLASRWALATIAAAMLEPAGRWSLTAAAVAVVGVYGAQVARGARRVAAGRHAAGDRHLLAPGTTRRPAVGGQ